MRVGKVLRKDHPNNLEIVNVVGGGESPWACVEMRSRTKSHSGEFFFFPFPILPHVEHPSQKTKFGGQIKNEEEEKNI